MLGVTRINMVGSLRCKSCDKEFNPVKDESGQLCDVCYTEAFSTDGLVDEEVQDLIKEISKGYC